MPFRGRTPRQAGLRRAGGHPHDVERRDLAGLAVPFQLEGDLISLLQACEPGAVEPGNVDEDSGPPPSGPMKPNPLAWLKDFTVPDGMARCYQCRGPDVGFARQPGRKGQARRKTCHKGKAGQGAGEGPQGGLRSIRAAGFPVCRPGLHHLGGDSWVAARFKIFGLAAEVRLYTFSGLVRFSRIYFRR